MRVFIGVVFVFLLGLIPAHAKPVTYQILLEGEGQSNGITTPISATGSFVWDSENLVDFNDYCSTNCGGLPTLALVESIDFYVPQLGAGISALAVVDTLGIFNQEYGYLFFDGSALFGFCLVTLTQAFGCDQAGGGMPSGTHSSIQAIFEGDTGGFGYQFLISGNDWQYQNPTGPILHASGTLEISEVPLPAALPLFLSALFGFGAIRRLKEKSLNS